MTKPDWNSKGRIPGKVQRVKEDVVVTDNETDEMFSAVQQLIQREIKA